MNVANLKLCKELYELSGWVSDYIFSDGDPTDTRKVEVGVMTSESSYAYDLGYLLRKLQVNIQSYDRLSVDFLNTESKWVAVLNSWGEYEEADTPEDAACKLAIELFKQGILKKGETHA